IHPS
ncbi:hypothetical protein D031_0012B, partial [Vibrio parahaemolyticus VP-48]